MTTGSIHTIGNGRNFLTSQDLQPLRSLWSESATGRASEKYRQIKTMDIMGIFESQGWLPVAAQEMRTNLETRNGFQKHLVRFRNRDSQALQAVGDTIPEIILKNSHGDL
jgi:hypothetical protein